MVSFQRNKLTCRVHGRIYRAAEVLQQAEKNVWTCPWLYTHPNGLIHVYMHI